jgi:HK97 family phage prohead protease
MERMACGLMELKFDGSEAETMSVSGYGAFFGNEDSYGDVIIPGAFAETLAQARKSGQWPAMLAQHGMGLDTDGMTPVGIWTDMADDGKGLRVTGKLADTPRGRELYTLLKMQPRPAINGLSIGYRAKEWSMRSKPDEPRRTLKKLDLVEVSFVTFPANPKARVQQVKAAEMTERELERLLTQDAGLSRKEARALMRQGIAGLKAMQDAGDESINEVIEALKRNVAIIQPTK